MENEKPYEPKYGHASYLSASIRTDRLHKIVPQIVAVLSRYDFDAIAFRGMSGTLLASPVAMAMNKTLLGVRKITEGCHSDRMVEGDHGARRYVIVDDCVSSGTTARNIIEEIAKVAPDAKCIGVLQTDEVTRCWDRYGYALAGRTPDVPLTEVYESGYWNQSHHLITIKPVLVGERVPEEVSEPPLGLSLSATAVVGAMWREKPEVKF